MRTNTMIRLLGVGRVVRPKRTDTVGIFRKASYKWEDDVQNLLKRLWQDEEGQDLVEYALLLVLISLVAAATIQTLGASITAVFTNANTSLTSVTT
jgi:pilus assembly protein Flp/PilA